jgi:hypothetical protein
MAESGSWYPTIVTSVIVLVLTGSLYGIRRRRDLCASAVASGTGVITAIYPLRGLVLAPFPAARTALRVLVKVRCPVFIVHPSVRVELGRARMRTISAISPLPACTSGCAGPFIVRRQSVASIRQLRASHGRPRIQGL